MQKKIIIMMYIFIINVSFGATAKDVIELNDGVVSSSSDPTPEISTNELKEILDTNGAWVFDARPKAEYAMSHIPNALNVSQKPGTPIDEYIPDPDEIARIVDHDKHAEIILYCNGPYCGKTKRLALELIDAGFVNVKRYQAGSPVWRALVGTMQIEAPAVREVWLKDWTAKIFDARPHDKRCHGPHIPRSIVLPIDDVKTAKKDGRLPMNDHNTRIICFGESAEQAKALADAISGHAFHNVTFFAGTPKEFRKAIFHQSRQ